jgi:hypothetical protein
MEIHGGGLTSGGRVKAGLLGVDRPYKADSRNSSMYNFQMAFAPKVESFINQAAVVTASIRLSYFQLVLFFILSFFTHFTVL